MIGWQAALQFKACAGRMGQRRATSWAFGLQLQALRCSTLTVVE